MSVDTLRAITRPFLLFFMAISSVTMILLGLQGEWAGWWIKLTLAGIGEWILERPLLKIAGK